MPLMQTKDGLLIDSEDLFRMLGQLIREPSRLLNISDAARYRGVSKQGLAKLIDTGALIAHYIGRTRYIRIADLDTLPQANTREMRSLGRRRRHKNAKQVARFP